MYRLIAFTNGINFYRWAYADYVTVQFPNGTVDNISRGGAKYLLRHYISRGATYTHKVITSTAIVSSTSSFIDHIFDWTQFHQKRSIGCGALGTFAAFLAPWLTGGSIGVAMGGTAFAISEGVIAAIAGSTTTAAAFKATERSRA